MLLAAKCSCWVVAGCGLGGSTLKVGGCGRVLFFRGLEGVVGTWFLFDG